MASPPRPLTFRTSPADTARPHYECLVSICVHDAPEFILEQLRNINEHVPQCCIVLHVNSASLTLDETTLPANVWLNPQWIPITRSHDPSLMLGFVSNVVHAYTVATFDRVLFLSSSTLFFRPVVWATFPKTAVCITSIANPPDTPLTLWDAQRSSVWWWSTATRDARLLAWMQRKGIARIGGGQISGTLLPESTLADLIDLMAIEETMSHKFDYPVEEIYAQTVGLAFATAHNLPVFPGLILTHWFNGEDAYFCRTPFVFDAAEARPSTYGLCKIHPAHGSSMTLLRELQQRVAAADSSQ